MEGPCRPLQCPTSGHKPGPSEEQKQEGSRGLQGPATVPGVQVKLVPSKTQDREATAGGSGLNVWGKTPPLPALNADK